MFNLPTSKKTTEKKPSELITEFANPWLQQTQVLKKYEDEFLNNPNVAIEMPTGTGKTLVGLTIAHYKQNAERLKVVYLCPNKQLARQVHEEARKNNINTCLITNSKTPKENFSPADIDKYNQAKSIAITTYSGLFNTNPKTQNPDVIICDDINAAEDAINNMWTIEIDKEHQPTLYSEIKSQFNNFKVEYYSSEDRVDLVELSSWYDNKENILNLLQNCNQESIRFTLQNLGNNIEICNIFVSYDKILIKPFLPPTFKNLHYHNAKQRIFLSATMGITGDIERLTGINDIKYIKCDETSINGLRFFILPHLLDNKKIFFLEYIKNSKTLLIVNSNKTRDDFIKFFEKELPQLTIFTNDNIEKANDSITPFLENGENTILILPNRFYGIDLPEDKCRRIIMYNLPLYSNLQEKFFWNALGANSRFKEKIGIRIVQAVGRCTRKKNDFASILLFDKDLISWLQDIRNSETLPNQLQIELDIANNNTVTESSKLIEQLQAFENETESRQQLNEYISENITNYTRKDDSINAVLSQCALKEIIYLQRLWGKDYNNAYKKAVEIINLLKENKSCVPYKAFWNYLASCIAFLAIKNGDISADWSAIYSRHINDAINMTPTVNWLNNAKQGLKIQQNDYPDLTLILNTLNELKFKSGKFANKITNLKEKINSDTAKSFSETLTTMGKLLGYHSFDWENDDSSGTPDCVWCGTIQGLSFEAKTMTEREDKPISCNYIGQMARQQQWAKRELNLSIPLTSIMITKQYSIQKDALQSRDEKDRYITPTVIREIFALLTEMYIDLSNKTLNLSVEETRSAIYQELMNKKLLLSDIITRLQKFDTLKTVG